LRVKNDLGKYGTTAFDGKVARYPVLLKSVHGSIATP
jgi:hypothetical protein